MTLLQCANLQPVLTEIRDASLPFKLAYKLAKLSKIVDSNFEFYRENLVKLIDTYGDRDENGQIIQSGDNIQIRMESLSEFQEKYAELKNTEITDELPKFDPEEFDGNFTFSTVEALMPIFD